MTLSLKDAVVRIARDNPDAPAAYIAAEAKCSVATVYKHLSDEKIQVPSGSFASGVSCPECGLREVPVKDSRPATYNDLEAIRRRRHCKCGCRFNTYEIRETDFDQAIKIAIRALVKPMLEAMDYTDTEILEMLMEDRRR